MYLIHFAVLAPSIWVAEELAPSNDWRTMAVHFALCSAASFALARITYAFVEAPAIGSGCRPNPSSSGEG